MRKGMGVMLHELSSNDNARILNRAFGQKIVSVELKDDALHFCMEDGYRFKLFDDGQSCCETRYMHTDDRLSDFVGAELRDAEIRTGTETEEDYETKESQFLIVFTSLGEFTMVNYNEHNGWYGGFAMVAEEESA